MKYFVEIYPKEKCLEIGKVVYNSDNDDGNLCYVDNCVFGKLNRAYTDESDFRFSVGIEVEGSDGLTWSVPWCFVKAVFNEEEYNQVKDRYNKL